jgi:hypothetical protein
MIGQHDNPHLQPAQPMQGSRRDLTFSLSTFDHSGYLKDHIFQKFSSNASMSFFSVESVFPKSTAGFSTRPHSTVGALHRVCKNMIKLKFKANLEPWCFPPAPSPLGFYSRLWKHLSLLNHWHDGIKLSPAEVQVTSKSSQSHTIISETRVPRRRIMPIAERIMCQSALESMASHPPLSPRLQLAVIVNDSLEGLMGMRPYWVKDQDIVCIYLLSPKCDLTSRCYYRL